MTAAAVVVGPRTFLKLTGAPANGKAEAGTLALWVGKQPQAGSTSAHGLASEVKDGISGDVGLVLEKDGFGIEAMGGTGVTYDQLVALTDQLQGLP